MSLPSHCSASNLYYCRQRRKRGQVSVHKLFEDPPYLYVYLEKLYLPPAKTLCVFGATPAYNALTVWALSV